MAKVNMKREGREEPATPANAPEKTVHIMEPRAAASLKRDKPTPEIGHESASPPDVIDADWVEMSKESTDTKSANVPTPPASNTEESFARPRLAREKSSEFSFVNYLLLFFSAALLSALVMLAIMGQV